jgi:hypothetical protein
VSTNYYPEPVAGDVHEIMRQVLANGFPPEMLDVVRELQGGPHRLSRETIESRVEAMRGQEVDRIRAGLQQIVDEDELFRWGFDLGYEAGYDKAVAEMNTHLRSVRPEPPRPSGAPVDYKGAVVEMPDERWTDTGSGPGYEEPPQRT